LILVFQVIGVLPNIVSKDREMALQEWAVLIGCGDDLQLAAIVDQPAPAGAKLFGGGFVELLLEILEAAKILLDLVCDLAGGLSAALRLHDLPEHGVVH